MREDPIRGKTLTFRFDDGPMAGKAFEHTFTPDGNVTYHAAGATGGEPPVHYELARITDDVYAISYLGAGGYALTAVLDFATGGLTAFASNEQSLTAQHGRFEPARRAA